MKLGRLVHEDEDFQHTHTKEYHTICRRTHMSTFYASYLQSHLIIIHITNFVFEDFESILSRSCMSLLSIVNVSNELLPRSYRRRET